MNLGKISAKLPGWENGDQTQTTTVSIITDYKQESCCKAIKGVGDFSCLHFDVVV